MSKQRPQRYRGQWRLSRLKCEPPNLKFSTSLILIVQNISRTSHRSPLTFASMPSSGWPQRHQFCHYQIRIGFTAKPSVSCSTKVASRRALLLLFFSFSLHLTEASSLRITPPTSFRCLASSAPSSPPSTTRLVSLRRVVGSCPTPFHLTTTGFPSTFRDRASPLLPPIYPATYLAPTKTAKSKKQFKTHQPQKTPFPPLLPSAVSSLRSRTLLLTRLLGVQTIATVLSATPGPNRLLTLLPCIPLPLLPLLRFLTLHLTLVTSFRSFLLAFSSLFLHLLLWSGFLLLYHLQSPRAAMATHISPGSTRLCHPAPLPRTLLQSQV